MASVAAYKRLIILIIVVVLLFAVAGTVFVAIKYNSDVGTLVEQNRVLKQQNDGMQQQLGELDALRAQLEEYEQRRLHPESIGEPIPYQTKFPDFYAPEPAAYVRTEKVVYLTFDDGPSKVMERVLNTLKEHNVKATFFVVGDDLDGWKSLLQRAVNEGHALAMHSSTHKYKVVYESVESFLDEFDRNFRAIYEATGVKPTVVRFPGGSLNSYNRAVYKEIISELYRRGFTYYDWNVSAEDAAGAKTAGDVYSNVVDYAGSYKMPNVLMHCAGGNGITADALPDIIKTLKSRGYEFGVLDNTIMPVTFGYQAQ